jgi:hypothetical protein
VKAVSVVLRACLSVLAAWVAWSVFRFIHAGIGPFGSSKPPIHAPTLGRSASSEPVETFWPRYPGLRSEGVHASRLNGVALVTEEGHVAIQADAVLDYYREQMTARGWVDVTEEHFRLSPEARVGVEGRDGLNDPEFVTRYEAVMDSNLVLRRQGWVVHATLSSGRKSRTTHVRLVAAQTPSVEELGLALSRDLLEGEKRRRPREVLLAEEERGGTRFATRQLESGLSPDRFYAELAAEYRQRGWRLLFERGAEGAVGQCFAVFQNGATQVSVVTMPSRVGRGTTALVTEMNETWREGADTPSDMTGTDATAGRVATRSGRFGARAPWMEKLFGGGR